MTYAAEGLENAELGKEADAESVEPDENGFVIDENGVLTKYTGDAEDVVIPDHVTGIGSYVLQRCNPKSIYIPKSVCEIDPSAFAENRTISWDDDFYYQLSSLKNLEVASDNPYFSSEDGVLYDKNKETLICCPNGRTGSFIVPAGVSIIESRAFESCQLTSIEISAGVTEIRDTFFCRNALELTELNVAAGNQNFSSEDGILYDKDKKTLLTCPGGKIGNVDIPEGVTSIAAFSFAICPNLSYVRIPSSVTSIGEYAFGRYRGLTGVTIPAGVTSIGNRAFSGCYELQNVNISSGVTSIGANAFSNCRSLTELTIPDGMTSIGEYAFSKCRSLTKIILPESVTSIGDNAFDSRNENLTIFGKSGSIAETYAKENNINFSSTGIVSPKTLSDKDVTLSQTSYTYDGTAKMPDVTVKYGNTPLTKDADYTVKYQDNVNAGTAKVIVTGTGNYTGTVTKTFTITEADKPEPTVKELSKCTITISKTAYTYDGTAKEPAVTVKDGATVLKAGTDYTVAYQDNKNAGTAKAVLTGKGNYRNRNENIHNHSKEKHIP